MKIRNHIQGSAQVLVSLFVSYMLMISCFTHTHVVNGVTIAHSHPYAFWKKDAAQKLLAKYTTESSSDKGTSNHKHSQDAIVLIDLISHFVSADLPAVWTVDVPVRTVPVLYAALQTPTHSTDPPSCVFLRGPPALV